MDAHVLELLAQVGAALVHLVGILRQQCVGQRPTGDDVVLAAVRLQPADRGDEDRGIGRSPDMRHLMLKNRSAPMSAPKPASVTR